MRNLGVDRALGIDDHEHQQRHHEHDGTDDGDTIEVLLDDARTRLGRIHRARDHIGDARALAGMHQDEDDHADARHHQQDEEEDDEPAQDPTLLSTTIILQRTNHRLYPKHTAQASRHSPSISEGTVRPTARSKVGAMSHKRPILSCNRNGAPSAPTPTAMSGTGAVVWAV